MPGELRSALPVCVAGTAFTTPSLADLTREPLEVQRADVESAQIARVKVYAEVAPAYHAQDRWSK
jgi:hypothetical protein